MPPPMLQEFTTFQPTQMECFCSFRHKIQLSFGSLWRTVAPKTAACRITLELTKQYPSVKVLFVQKMASNGEVLSKWPVPQILWMIQASIDTLSVPLDLWFLSTTPFCINPRKTT